VDDYPWFAIVFAAILAVWIYKLVAHGGFRGAMFGARIRDTVGELDITSSRFMKQKLVIYRLDSERPSNDPAVGLEMRFTSFASYQMQPLPLTKSQARTLSQLLARAAE